MITETGLDLPRARAGAADGHDVTWLGTEYTSAELSDLLPVRWRIGEAIGIAIDRAY